MAWPDMVWHGPDMHGMESHAHSLPDAVTQSMPDAVAILSTSCLEAQRVPALGFLPPCRETWVLCTMPSPATSAACSSTPTTGTQVGCQWLVQRGVCLLLNHAHYGEAHCVLSHGCATRPCTLPSTFPTAGQNLMLALNYVHHGEARLVCEAHEEWGHSFQALHPPLPPLTLDDVDAAEGRPLVVSWQGGCAHGACIFLCPVLRARACRYMARVLRAAWLPWLGDVDAVQGRPLARAPILLTTH